MQPNAPQPPQTYLGQVFDRPANWAILVLVGLAFLAGWFLKNEGRWFIWVACLIVLGVFFLAPLFSREKRRLRGK